MKINLVVLVFACTAFSSSAANVVAPSILTSTEGQAGNSAPFGIGVISQRYQQVYEANLFSSIPAAGAIITGMAFRVDSGGNSFTSTLPDIQINLSTTSFGENPSSGNPGPFDNYLRREFADNVGWDDTIVYARGALTLSGTGGGAPNPFDVLINLTTPFTYNPANGNLLLDVRNYGGGTSTFFDGTFGSGDGMSRVMSIPYEFSPGLGVNSGQANYWDTLGLVTQFIYQPVPEPTSSVFCRVGLAVFLCFKIRQRTSSKGFLAKG
ncbi:MAG: hypothetical protein HOP33_16680 [Verrucomicrobia bacterium]|nr:hypothetical protein [Verrucomicrobiota bacterium]